MERGNITPEPQTKRDTAIDISGLCTGVPVTKRLVFGLLAAGAAFLVCSLLPLGDYGANTGEALGFLVSMIMLIIFMPVNIALCGVIIAVGGIALGFWDWGTVGATFGSSSFLSIFGMLIVAMGCEFTPFGKRVAYLVLRRYGHAPKRMVFMLAVVSACLSSFISNVAVIIMMSGICAGLLSAMGQEPGKSPLGKTLMLIIPMAAIVGGIVLINGSPTGNTMAIMFLTNATGGEYTVTYGQWAICGVACFLITVIPMCLVYIKCFRLSDKELELPSREYYDALLRELGPMGGSEIRWLIIIVGMVTCMLLGMKTGVAALLFAAVSMFPGIGTLPADKAIKKLPLNIMMASGFVPLLATLFSDTGLGDLMGDWITPLVSSAGPLGLSMISALIMGILVNAFVNANLAVSALVIGVVAPICVRLGYNPSLILMPSFFIASFFFVMGAHNIMLLNKGYGYWEMRDPIIPGIIVVILSGIIFPIICYYVGPVFGMSVFI